MYGLDYDHLSNIRDTRGREAAYAEQLKVAYYNRVHEEGYAKLVRSSELSGKLIKESVDDFNRSFKEECNQLSCSIDELGDTLIDIDEELNNIHSELNNISGVLDWGFNMIIENQRLNLLVLTSIEELSKIPDREKERIRFIQLGIELQNEAFYNPKLYKNAIKHYMDALKLYEEDPFVLNRLGFIHLYAADDVDFMKAAKYFEEAVNFILPKYYTKKHLDDNAVYDKMPGLLAPQLFKNLRQQTVLSLFYAAHSNLLLNNSEAAKKYLRNALAITPEFQEAKYLYIKALLMSGELEPVEQLINEMLQQSPLYYFKFKRDKTLLHYPLVINYVNQYHQKQYRAVDQEITEIGLAISPGSILTRHYHYILAAFRTNNFLGLVRAQKLLAKQITAEFLSFQYEA